MDKEELIKTKACTKCGTTHNIDFFSPNERRCKNCMKAKRGANSCRIKPDGKLYFKKCNHCGKLTHIDNIDLKYSYCIDCSKSYTHTRNYKRLGLKSCHIDIRSKVYFKRCLTCGELKPVDQFNKAKTQIGFISKCKACQKIKNTEYSVKRRNSKFCRIKITFPIYFKVCTKCGELKSVRDFHKEKKHQYQCKCKECKKSQATKNNTFCNLPLYTGKIYFKYCNDCKDMLPISAYYKHKTTTGLGYVFACKSCHIAKGSIQKQFDISISEIPQEIIELNKTLLIAKRELKQHTTA